MGVEAFFGNTFITSRLQKLINWGRKYSLWPLPFGTACCGIEYMSVLASYYDASRFGAEVVRFSPRQSDVLVVAGTINQKMAPVLRRIHDQMMEPKWVIAMGACASAGCFYDNYAVVQGIDRILPVDMYVAGCPPKPESVLHSLEKLQDKVDEQPIAKEREKYDPETLKETFAKEDEKWDAWPKELQKRKKQTVEEEE